MNLTLGLTKSFGTRDYVFSTSDDSKVDFFFFSMLLSLDDWKFQAVLAKVALFRDGRINILH
jgi:hypothetical protein